MTGSVAAVQALRRAAERAGGAGRRLVAGQPIALTHPELLRPEELQPGVAAGEFALRRRRLAAALPPGGLAVLAATPPVYMAGVIPYPYRPDADFLYLTGIQQPSAVAVLQADARLTLVVPDQDSWRETWDGAHLSEQAAGEVFGADDVATLSQLPKLLEGLVPGASVVLCDADRSAGLLAAAPALAAARARLRPLRPLLHRLRWRKSPAELALMRRSAAVAARAMAEAMAASTPGVHESDLAALFAYRCARGGAARMAYPPVVAGGADALTIHYSRNDKRVAGGQMVLFDGGCELHGYASDITRTWPVSGRYSPEQRALYEAVLETHRRCIAAVRPGATLRQLHHLSVTLLSSALCELGVLRGREAREVAAGGAYRAFYPHSACHWLGLDTHDAATVSHDLPLEPGVVLTVEPGLYIPDDPHLYRGFAGLGVRIEDDVAVTELAGPASTGALGAEPAAGCASGASSSRRVSAAGGASAAGHEVLSAGLPVEVDEVEALVGSRPELLAAQAGVP